MTTDLFTYLFKLLSDYLRAEFQTGYIVVNCRALTFTVVTVHCNMLNAYDDEWVHLRIYLFMRRWITFGWLRNYGAKVTMSVYDAHGWGGGIVACDIFMIRGLAMCDSLWQRGGRGSNLVEKSVIYFLNGPTLLSNLKLIHYTFRFQYSL